MWVEQVCNAKGMQHLPKQRVSAERGCQGSIYRCLWLSSFPPRCALTPPAPRPPRSPPLPPRPRAPAEKFCRGLRYFSGSKSCPPNPHACEGRIPPRRFVWGGGWMRVRFVLGGCVWGTDARPICTRIVCGGGGCASDLYSDSVCGGRMRVRFVLGGCVGGTDARPICTRIVCVCGAAPRRGRARRAPGVARTPTLPPANNGARMPRVTGPMRTRNARRAAAASAGRGRPRDCPATCPRTPTTPTLASPRWRRAGPFRCSPAATRCPRSPRTRTRTRARPRPGAAPRQTRPAPLPRTAPRCPWLPRGSPHPLRGMVGRPRPRCRRSPPYPLRSRPRRPRAAPTYPRGAPKPRRRAPPRVGRRACAPHRRRPSRGRRPRAGARLRAPAPPPAARTASCEPRTKSRGGSRAARPAARRLHGRGRGRGRWRGRGRGLRPAVEVVAARHQQPRAEVCQKRRGGPDKVHAAAHLRVQCPVSTGGGTRCVQLVREEGRDVSD
jgi:hypothetical protein